MKRLRHAGLVARIAGATALIGLLLAGVFAALLFTISDRRSVVDSAHESTAALTTSFGLQTLVLDAETGIRGYLLTHQPPFLQPYNVAVKDLPEQEAALDRSLVDTPAQLARAHALGTSIAAYMSDWARPAIGSASKPRIEALIISGKRRVDALRNQFATFDSVERSLAASQTAHANSLATIALELGALGLIAALVLMTLTAVYAARLVAPIRRVGRAARRVADYDLDVRVEEEGIAEVRELGASFNQMADALRQGREELETQNAELEAQQTELQTLLDEVALEKSRVERFHEFAQALAGEIELAPVGHSVLTYLCTDAVADVGALYVLDELTGSCRLSAARGVRTQALPETITPGDGIAGRALRERRTLIVAPGDSGLPVATMAGEQPARYELSLPLLLGNEVAGVVTLGRIEDRRFSPAEVTAAELLADQAAVAVARARMQRETTRSLRTVQGVLDATPDPIALVGPDRAVVFENQPMADLRTMLVGEESARDAFDVPGDDLARQGRDELSLGDGQRVLARYAAPLTGPDEAVIGRIVVLRDITAEREAERLKDEFFALVSHELRTPLTSIIGYLELALEENAAGPLDEERRRFLEVIDRNAKRLLRLVGDLLFVAQVEAGTMSLAHGEFDLAQLAREAVQAATPRAATAGVGLELEITGELPTAHVDGDRIGQMLDNLIVNAIKFTPPGGAVTVRLRAAGGVAELEVSDTGVGISAEDLTKLFDRFFRAREASERGVPGVGLGLTIVQAIVHGHGGRITADSTPGLGTTFRVRLPLAGIDGAGLSVSAARSRAGAAPED